MSEETQDINQKNINSLSRNIPVAFVVGAAGFLSSHLTDRLLDKGIQVVGVDELKEGQKQNLDYASRNRNFHQVTISPDKFDFDFPRLDYLFIIYTGPYNLDKVLSLFKKHRCRCVLVSSIDLYQKENENQELRWLRNMESKIAKFAAENSLNARVLRLGALYGPRMDFKSKDPLVKLIAQTLSDQLQKEIFLEFSSRALFVSDAVDLIIRTIFAGSTAQKVFDGVLPTPVKVSEVKQVMMDPLWYESRDFRFTELPPWPTPNLEKTLKVLHWKPKYKLVAGLRETLSYLKDNEIAAPPLSEENPPMAEEKEIKWDQEKKAALEQFKQINKGGEKGKEKSKPFRVNLPLSKIYLWIVIALVSIGLVWPSIILGWGVFAFRYQLDEGLKNLQKGNLEQSLIDIEQANAGAAEIESIYEALEPLRRTGLFKKQFETGDNIISVFVLSATSARSVVLGTQALLSSIKSITGETTDSPAQYFDYAQLQLRSAGQDLSKAQALIENDAALVEIPIIGQKVTRLKERIDFYVKLVHKQLAISILLPELVAPAGRKDYLVLLQNNMELRPTGGFIGSFALVSFEGGKLKKLGVNDIYAIDGNLGIHVEPPKEIKEDLDQKDWFLRDSNWEPDFPTSARQAEWFFTKETGNTVEGVIALDVSAIESLLGVVGPLDLPDYSEKITRENLFEKAISYAELKFFPGSQAKKSFLTALTNALFEKMFFLPQDNWPAIFSQLGKSLDEKHISIYLNDPKLFSYVLSQNWTNILPRQIDAEAGRDFLSLVEANLGANKTNYYLDRSYGLETIIGKGGEIRHKLRINYINRSPSDAFPGGIYKNRMRLYLPLDSKLNKATWGEAEITEGVSSFIDYGRTGYSLLLELAPKEQRTLVLDYTIPTVLEFKEDRASYRLDIIKQAGTLKDPLQWSISYPISFELISNQTEVVGPQEQTFSTDLSTDRSFQVEFKR